MQRWVPVVAMFLVGGVLPRGAAAQSGTAATQPARGSAPVSPGVARALMPASEYIIGPDDVLEVTFWREQDISAEVVVRPDGKISLPLLNDIEAAGLTPRELRDRVVEGAKRFVENPTATIVVKQINSRKVFITGAISKPGPYPLTGPTTVLQLIAMAGGVTEWADTKNILIIRGQASRQVPLQFNYKDVSRSKNLSQNIQLEPGDTIVVPQ